MSKTGNFMMVFDIALFSDLKSEPFVFGDRNRTFDYGARAEWFT